MKYRFLFLLSLCLITINGCQWLQPNKPIVNFDVAIKGKTVAVLNLQPSGSFLPTGIGKYSADRLSDEFFMSGYAKVIDRSKVNEAQVKLQLRSTEFLSHDNIQQIGLKLKADYLVLGTVNSITQSMDFGEESEKTITIQVRVVSVQTSEIAGMASYSCNSSENPELLIRKMILEIFKCLTNA